MSKKESQPCHTSMRKYLLWKRLMLALIAHNETLKCVKYPCVVHTFSSPFLLMYSHIKCSNFHHYIIQWRLLNGCFAAWLVGWLVDWSSSSLLLSCWIWWTDKIEIANFHVSQQLCACCIWCAMCNVHVNSLPADWELGTIQDQHE